jgi:hypothetical protein
MARAEATTDHEKIREWAESRDGRPARVKGTGGRSKPAILRIDFPGFSGEDTLEPISWEEFFEQFDRAGLAFLYQDEPNSRFFKLVKRETVSGRGGQTRGRRQTSSKQRSTRTRSAGNKKGRSRKRQTTAAGRKSRNAGTRGRTTGRQKRGAQKRRQSR